MNQTNRVLRTDVSTTIGTWEPFKWISLGGNKVALQATIDNFYVTCNLNDSNLLEAQSATSAQSWETFSWLDLGPH